MKYLLLLLATTARANLINLGKCDRTDQGGIFISQVCAYSADYRTGHKDIYIYLVAKDFSATPTDQELDTASDGQAKAEYADFVTAVDRELSRTITKKITQPKIIQADALKEEQLGGK